MVRAEFGCDHVSGLSACRSRCRVKRRPATAQPGVSDQPWGSAALS